MASDWSKVGDIARRRTTHLDYEVIGVEVDELHKGKILSRPSTSMTISAVAQENKKNNESMS